MKLLPYLTSQSEAGCDEAGRGCLAGPVVAAAVILPKGYNNIQLNDSKKISEILTKKLAKYKCPKGYIFVNSFPRNSLGKILKNKLREEYKNYFK